MKRIELTYHECECRCGYRVAICLETENIPKWALCPCCEKIIKIQIPCELKRSEEQWHIYDFSSR